LWGEASSEHSRTSPGGRLFVDPNFDLGGNLCYPTAL